jgi:hypothetical protein
MTFFVVVSIIAYIISFALGFTVLLHDFRSAKNRLFAVFCFACIVWTGSNFLFRLTDHAPYDFLLFGSRAVFVGAAATMVSFLALLSVLIESPFSKKRLAVIVVIVVGTALIASAANPWLILDVWYVGGRPVFSYGPMMIPFYTVMAVQLGLVIATLSKAKMRDGGQDSEKTFKIIKIAFYCVMAFILITNYFIPMAFNNHDFSTLGSLAILAYLAIVAYLIVWKGLFSLRFITVRLLSYAIVIAIFAGIYMLLFELIFHLLFKIDDPTGEVFVLNAMMVIIMMMLYPILSELHRFLKRLLYADIGKVSVKHLVQGLDRLIGRRVSPAKVANLISQTLELGYVGIVLPPRGEKWRVYGSGGAKRQTISWVEAANIYNSTLKMREKALKTAEAPNAGLKDTLEKHNISVVVRLYDINEGVIGAILLGKTEQGGQEVPDSALKVLLSVTNLVSLAVEGEAKVRGF